MQTGEPRTGAPVCAGPSRWPPPRSLRSAPPVSWQPGRQGWPLGRQPGRESVGEARPAEKSSVRWYCLESPFAPCAQGAGDGRGGAHTGSGSLLLWLDSSQDRALREFSQNVCANVTVAGSVCVRMHTCTRVHVYTYVHMKYIQVCICETCNLSPQCSGWTVLCPGREPRPQEGSISPPGHSRLWGAPDP